MNNSELIEMLCHYCYNFGGVFAADELNEIGNNAYYILNTDPIDKKGQHWVVMNINDNLCEFFDSAGNHPSYYHEKWHDFLLEKTGAYVYNDLAFQKQNTQVCGEYCALYIILRSNKVLFSKLIRYLECINIDNTIKYQLNSMLCYSINPRKAIKAFITRLNTHFNHWHDVNSSVN